MSLLGIDLGTSGVRVAAYSGDGDQLAVEAASLELLRTRERVELDVAVVLATVEECLRKINTAPTLAQDAPEALSFSVLGEAIVPLDGALQPLSLGPVSMDPRGTRIVEGLRNTVGEQRFQEITGQPLHPMFSIFKIAADLDGAWSAPGTRFATFDAVVAARLGAKLATDQSMAARMGCYDVGAGAWSEEILAAVAGVTGPRIDASQLPAVVEAGTVIGHLDQQASLRIGLPEGLPIVAGAHDQAASWVGIGGSPGEISAFALGSSDCLTFGHDGRPDDLVGTGLATYPLRAGQWVTLAGTAAGGWALQWFADLVGAPVSELFSDLQEQPSLLLVLPYLAGSGTLDNDPAATGVIAGLTLSASRHDVASALVEAAGFELGKILAALTERSLEVGRIVATGGGAGNLAALRARANAAGVPLISHRGQASGRGAAMFAGMGIGRVRTVPAVDGPTTGPPTDVDWYTQRRAAYRDLYTSLRSLSL